MRYQCVSCDVRFDVDGERPRCPRCRKTTGLELVPTAAPGRSLRTPILLGLAALVIGGGYVWWSSRAPEAVPSKVPLSPLEDDELRQFARDRGVTAKKPPAPFETSEELRRFAERAAKGKSGAAALAAIANELGARRRRGDFSPFEGVEPRDTEVRTAARTFAGIAAKRRPRRGAEDRPYSLELAAVLAAAGRAVDVPAMLVEVTEVPDERAPLDPSGYRGHFGVVLQPGSRRPGKALDVFDPHRGTRARLAADTLVVLDDVAVLGHFLNHQALYKLGQASDPAAALERVELGLELAPRAPAILGTRGAILLASGGVDEGTRELERAFQLRKDAVRRHNLGAAYLVAGDNDRASREIGAAIAQAPDFASARASLAALHIARGELEDAERELRTAEQLDSELSTVPMLWANLHVARHEPDAAVARAQQAVHRRPGDDRTRLLLASLYHEIGRITDMTHELRLVLRRTRQPEQMRELVRANFGPAALEAALEEEDTEVVPAEPLETPDGGVAADADGGAGGAYQLGSKVLGTGQTPGPRLNIGDGSQLHLGGSRESGGPRLRLGGDGP
jgi:Flp pilus assembly protein TadD